jgi:hypothetical protein
MLSYVHYFTHRSIQKRRNKLLDDRMRGLVFVKFNSKLRGKKERTDRDPLQREVDDVVGDDENEFITGIVPLPNDVVEPAQDGRSQEEQTSQAQVQVQAKRKRSMKPRKKLRSPQSLMCDVQVQVQQSSSDLEDGDIAMESSESDKSPHAFDSD